MQHWFKNCCWLEDFVKNGINLQKESKKKTAELLNLFIIKAVTGLFRDFQPQQRPKSGNRNKWEADS